MDERQKNSWIQLSINTTTENVELLSDFLEEIGALAITVIAADDSKQIFQVNPNEVELWNDCQLRALFSSNTQIDPLVDLIKKQNFLNPNFKYEIEEIIEEDWIRKTQENFQPQCFAMHLWVCPAWCETNALRGVKVKINPGHAFGTGTHPTTALCLEWLASYLPKNTGTIIDYGCGSGILGLSALALDASEVWMIDHDPQALQATKQNAALNDFANQDKLHILNSDDVISKKILLPSVDVVIANILATPLIELSEHLISLIKNNGKLVLSGILESEVERVKDAYIHAMSLETVSLKDGWSLLVFEKIEKENKL